MRYCISKYNPYGHVKHETEKYTLTALVLSLWEAWMSRCSVPLSFQKLSENHMFGPHYILSLH